MTGRGKSENANFKAEAKAEIWANDLFLTVSVMSNVSCVVQTGIQIRRPTWLALYDAANHLLREGSLEYEAAMDALHDLDLQFENKRSQAQS